MINPFQRKVLTPIGIFLAGAASGAGGLLGAQHVRAECRTPTRHLSLVHSIDQEFLDALNRQRRDIDSAVRDLTWRPFPNEDDIAVEDAGNEVVYRVPIENIKNKQVKVDVQDGLVTVTAKSRDSAENKKGDQLETEELISQFQKTFPLVAGANPAKMDFKIEKDSVVIRFPRLKGA